jgi:hypothetical protein
MMTTVGVVAATSANRPSPDVTLDGRPLGGVADCMLVAIAGLPGASGAPVLGLGGNGSAEVVGLCRDALYTETFLDERADLRTPARDPLTNATIAAQSGFIIVTPALHVQALIEQSQNR